MPPWLSCGSAKRDGGDQQTTVCIFKRVALAPDDAPGRIVAAFTFDAHTA